MIALVPPRLRPVDRGPAVETARQKITYSPNGLLLLMHAWFYGDKNLEVYEPFFGSEPDFINPQFKLNLNYLLNLNKLIEGHIGNIVNLDVAERICDSDKRIYELSGRCAPISIVTEGHFENGQPIEVTAELIGCPWSMLANQIRRPGAVYLAGGGISGGDGVAYSGCLGDAYEYLNEQGLDPRFLNGCCFRHI